MHKEKYVGANGYHYALYISNILKYTQISHLILSAKSMCIVNNKKICYDNY